jgi:phosphodiester glycosidase
VRIRRFQSSGAAGPVLGGLLEVDLSNAHVSAGLLHPSAVAARQTVTHMTKGQGAVAGVNGDFFNISETHAGVEPTGSASGPEVSGGHALKAAVPDGQRFGPALPPGTSAEDVLAVGTDGVGRLPRIPLTGTVHSGATSLPVRGLNQYAIPYGGIGAFTHAWGSMSRRRSVCGTNNVRTAPCSTETAQVTVRGGVVTAVSDAVGAGDIPSDTTVLVGRDKAADQLRALRPGDQVQVEFHLADQERYRFAIGGFPIRRGGAPPAGLRNVGSAPRTAAGLNQAGTRLYLLVVDGRSAKSSGLTLAELSALLGRVGASDGVNLDGGGSSTIAVRGPGRSAATVQNKPSDGAERKVANGIGVFTTP